MKQHTPSNSQGKRVVITGVGVCSPIGTGMQEFEASLRAGRSGIRHLPELEELNFRCQLGAVPELTNELMEKHFTPLERKRLTAKGVIYGIIAAMEAWEMAGLMDSEQEEPFWNRGTVFGTGMSGVHSLREAIYKTDEGKVKKLGSSVVEQTMPSGISAYLSGRLGLGNWVSTNASACSTGSESIIMAMRHLRSGAADIMLAGGCDADGPHVWGGFDAMRVLSPKHNDSPEEASRPMSSEASGFIPGSGGGALVLETLESAKKRGAIVYAEVLGGFLNSGGQKQGGSMTAPNSKGVQRCIEGAMEDAAVIGDDIDLIAGHLTSTMGDVLEIRNWSEALGRKGDDFPLVNSLKSMTGHCLSAAGAIESVAAVWQLHKQFVHPSLNSTPLHADIQTKLSAKCIPTKAEDTELNIVAKSSFGFGDVNSCLIFKKWS
jgi:3-oxoacyl-(acyl-carrier-protein) synthase